MLPSSQRGEPCSTARKWFKACQSGSGHKNCAKYRQQPRMRPTRLLYLDPSLPDLVQLVTTDEISDSSECSYVTLSHRWGAYPPLEPPRLSRHTATSNTGWISIKELQTGILQSSLPRTFRDALQIARHCEVRYIWIDCLCIVQDKDLDGKNPEWDREAVKMGDIYAGGLLYVTHLSICTLKTRHVCQGIEYMG